MAEDYIKDPDAVLDWNFDWSNWLDGDEEIDVSTFIVSSGITVASSSNTATSATVWLSGGTAGVYRVTNRVTTTSIPARTDDRSITIRVKER